MIWELQGGPELAGRHPAGLHPTSCGKKEQRRSSKVAYLSVISSLKMAPETWALIFFPMCASGIGLLYYIIHLVSIFSLVHT